MFVYIRYWMRWLEGVPQLCCGQTILESGEMLQHSKGIMDCVSLWYAFYISWITVYNLCHFLSNLNFSYGVCNISTTCACVDKNCVF